MTFTIRLRDEMLSDDGWGHQEGRRVHQCLLKIIEGHPDTIVFRISLDGVKRTDASFPRESVVELARRFREQKGFCLVDVADPDLLDNWDAAAKKREQPLLVWRSSGDFIVLGPELSEAMRLIFNVVVTQSGVTTAETAERLEQTVSNVSNKMKALFKAGYILRRERVAPSGGIEFEYFVTQ